jgi:hypothetical protein
MRARRFVSAYVALILVVAVSILLVGTTLAGNAKGRTLTATLTGAAEAPGPGDPDGSGSVVIVLDPGTGEVCYDWQVTGIQPPLTGAHIHKAPAGQPGPVVVPTPRTSDFAGDACVFADKRLVAAILAHPDEYYFNVHNQEYPAGALRGQLSR